MIEGVPGMRSDYSPNTAKQFEDQFLHLSSDNEKQVTSPAELATTIFDSMNPEEKETWQAASFADIQEKLVDKILSDYSHPDVDASSLSSKLTLELWRLLNPEDTTSIHGLH